MLQTLFSPKQNVSLQKLQRKVYHGLLYNRQPAFSSVTARVWHRLHASAMEVLMRKGTDLQAAEVPPPAKKRSRWRKSGKFIQTHFDWDSLGYITISEKEQKNGRI